VIPERLRWIADFPGGAEWLARLPHLVDECVEQWSLVVTGEPFPDSFVSVVVPVVDGDGTAAALKVQLPHRESEHEAAALARWDGNGAVRLLAHDPVRAALLLERCDPGAHLSTVDAGVALDVFVDLLPTLWVPAGAPFTTLADEAGQWTVELPATWERAGRPFERGLVDRAVGLLRELAPTQGPAVLLHQDLHADNVLSAERAPWLVIDPKPLAGEREFGIAPIVRGAELGHSEAAVRRRFDRLTAELGLGRERARGWAFAQTLAWAFGGDEVMPDLVQVARWLA
jgi:streptomycin 6-kinase